MAELVLVHGIGDPNEGDAEQMKTAWIEVLTAGSPPSTRDYWLQNAEMAFYRDWSWMKRQGAQGAGESDLELDEDFARYVDELARVWLESAANSSHSDLSGKASRELALLDGVEAEAQGPMRAVRASVAALSKIPIVANAGFGTLQRINRTNLWQVAAYVNDLEGSRDRVLERFESAVGPETKMVIGHSLGSVVAYEAVHKLAPDIEMLVTAGSPLGADNVVYDRLDPSALIPRTVKRWVNVADPDDPVAFSTTLANRFRDPEGAPNGGGCCGP